MTEAMVRAACEADLDCLAAIERLWDTTPRWSRAQFAAELAEPASVGVAAESQGAVSGYAFGRCVAGELQVLDIAVDPARARRGLGRALLKALLRTARGRGAARAHLEVAEGNAAARTLYESEGWRVVGRRPKFYNGTQDALLMSRDLADVQD